MAVAPFRPFLPQPSLKVRSLPEVAEYRAEVDERSTLPEIRITFEPTASCRDGVAVAKELEAKLRAAFSLRIPVRVAEKGSLPRFEMKARRWVRL